MTLSSSHQLNHHLVLSSSNSTSNPTSGNTPLSNPTSGFTPIFKPDIGQYFIDSSSNPTSGNTSSHLSLDLGGPQASVSTSLSRPRRPLDECINFSFLTRESPRQAYRLFSFSTWESPRRVQCFLLDLGVPLASVSTLPSRPGNPPGEHINFHPLHHRPMTSFNDNTPPFWQYSCSSWQFSSLFGHSPTIPSFDNTSATPANNTTFSNSHVFLSFFFLFTFTFLDHTFFFPSPNTPLPRVAD